MTSIEQRDVQSVLAGIDDLLPLLRKRAQETEDLRKIPEESIKDLDDLGFFKLLQPEQWGGFQCDPTAFYEAVRRIASACGSTGTSRCSTSRPRKRCGATTRAFGCHRRTRRWAPARLSTAATSSTARGTGHPVATMPRGRSSAAR